MILKNNKIEHFLYESVWEKDGSVFDKKIYMEDAATVENAYKQRVDEILKALSEEKTFHGYDTKSLLSFVSFDKAPMPWTMVIQNIAEDKTVLMLEIYDM